MYVLLKKVTHLVISTAHQSNGKLAINVKQGTDQCKCVYTVKNHTSNPMATMYLTQI